MRPMLAVSAAASLLSACAFSVETTEKDWDDDYGGSQVLSLRLDDGDRQRFSCPEGYDIFVETEGDETRAFGCQKPEGVASTDDG